MNRIKDILEKLKARNFKDFSDSRLAISLPVSKELFNLSFQSQENEMIEVFHFDKVHADHFLLDFKPKNYRQMRIKGVILQQIAFDTEGKAELQIRILQGINFLEKGAIMLFSSRLPDAINLTPSTLTVNLDKMFAQMDLSYLIPFVHWKSIETREDQLVFNFEIKI